MLIDVQIPLPALQLPGLPNVGGTKLAYTVKNIRDLQKKLKEIEPGLRTQFVREIKSIGKEAEKPIKSAIRQVTPLSGMINHYGATSWNNGSKPPDSTTVRFRTQAGGKSLNTTLVSVRLNSAATNIVDMAGRSGRSIGKGKRNSGLTPVIRRTASGDLVAYARRTPEAAGRNFIANLNAAVGVLKRDASRIAWPAVENDLPNFEKRIDGVVQKYYQIANRGSI
jgi:hypothetical protein